MVLKERIHKCDSEAKTLQILFHEQVVCGRGMKWKKYYMMTVDNIVM